MATKNHAQRKLNKIDRRIKGALDKMFFYRRKKKDTDRDSNEYSFYHRMIKDSEEKLQELRKEKNYYRKKLGLGYEPIKDKVEEEADVYEDTSPLDLDKIRDKDGTLWRVRRYIKGEKVRWNLQKKPEGAKRWEYVKSTTDKDKKDFFIKLLKYKKEESGDDD